MHLLLLLISIWIVSKAIILYIVFQETIQCLVALYQVISSLDLYDDIQELKKSIPYFGEFLFLCSMIFLIDRLEQVILCFDFAVIVFSDFGLNGNPCTKVNKVCFGVPWDLLVNYTILVYHQIFTVL